MLKLTLSLFLFPRHYLMAEPVPTITAACPENGSQADKDKLEFLRKLAKDRWFATAKEVKEFCDKRCVIDRKSLVAGLAIRRKRVDNANTRVYVMPWASSMDKKGTDGKRPSQHVDGPPNQQGKRAKTATPLEDDRGATPASIDTTTAAAVTSCVSAENTADDGTVEEKSSSADDTANIVVGGGVLNNNNNDEGNDSTVVGKGYECLTGFRAHLPWDAKTGDLITITGSSVGRTSPLMTEENDQNGGLCVYYRHLWLEHIKDVEDAACAVSAADAVSLLDVHPPLHIVKTIGRQPKNLVYGDGGFYVCNVTCLS